MFATKDISCVIVEMGESGEIIKNPLHPYTKTLIDSIPVPDPNKKWNTDEIGGTGGSF